MHMPIFCVRTTGSYNLNFTARVMAILAGDLVKSILEDQEKADPSKSTKVHKDVELDIDLGNLLASDYNPLDVKTLR